MTECRVKHFGLKKRYKSTSRLQFLPLLTKLALEKHKGLKMSSEDKYQTIALLLEVMQPNWLLSMHLFKVFFILMSTHLVTVEIFTPNTPKGFSEGILFRLNSLLVNFIDSFTSIWHGKKSRHV